MSNAIKWMIRTKNNHLLGPIVKEKLVNLLETNSLDEDDEVCSGNGYWFKIKEKEYVDRYILGDEILGFNPVSEALSEQRLREDQERGNALDATIERRKKDFNEDDTTEIVNIDKLLAQPEEKNKSDIGLDFSNPLNVNPLIDKEVLETPKESLNDEKKLIIEKLNKDIHKEEVKESKVSTVQSNKEYKDLKTNIDRSVITKYPFWSRIIFVRLVLTIALILLMLVMYYGIKIVDVFSVAYAQDLETEELVALDHKRDDTVEYSEMKFSPFFSISGFELKSSLISEKINCDDLLDVEVDYLSRFFDEKKFSVGESKVSKKKV